MLSRVAPNGTLLFVDYHRPARWQPVGWLLRLVNRYLEPFAYTMWCKNVQDFATESSAFIWRKRTIFGGVYQIVEARRIASDTP